MQKSWYRQIPLTPLGHEAIAELLGGSPRQRTRASPRWPAPIHARTGGNPFFTEEVAQTLIESGHLAGTRGAYRLVTPIERLGGAGDGAGRAGGAHRPAAGAREAVAAGRVGDRQGLRRAAAGGRGGAAEPTS